MSTRSYALARILALLAGALLPAGLAAAQPAAAAATPAAPPPWAPSDGPNHPMGVGRGIFPGRVTWIRDTSATPWDGKTGNWWDEGTGIRQPAVDNMLSRSLRALSGKAEDRAAWEALFQYFNQQQRQLKAGYRSGEKVAVKINCVRRLRGR
jgi:hypothetical protein